MRLLDATHLPGRHCASTGVRDLAWFHGLELSEAMCFGIGAGLGVWRLEAKSPSRMIHVRSEDLEAQFFRRLGLDFRWQRFENGPASHRALLAALDDGRPALLQSDIFHLPYYESGTHFPGHAIVAWGYDAARQVFLVSDTERPQLQEVPFEAMQLARFAKGPLFEMTGNMYAPQRVNLADRLEDVVAEAIVFCSQRLLNGPGDFAGVAALERWLADLPAWPELPDWRWAARFAYQIIERRGTGGGGFRLMYADFLDEAAEMLPEVGSLELPAMMRQTAQAWTDLANALKETSEGDRPRFEEPIQALATVLDAESVYHRRAADLGRAKA